MPILAADDFPAALPVGPVLGLDVGTLGIGLAISDPARSIALPLSVLKRQSIGPDLAALSKIVKERRISGLVIGLPLSLNGEMGERAEAVEGWAQKVYARPDLFPAALPALMWDERMSTVAVERFLRDDLDMSRAKRAKTVDAHAAAHILQGALDWLRNQ